MSRQTGGIIGENGLPMARCFAQAYGSGNQGAVDEMPEVLPDVGNDLLAQSQSSIVHGQDDAIDAQVLARRSDANLLDDSENFGEAFHGKVFTLKWDEHVFCRRERICHHDAEGRRTIEEHEIEGGFGIGPFFEDAPQARQAVGIGGEFDFATGHFHIGRDQGDEWGWRGAYLLMKRLGVEQNRIDALLYGGLHAQGASGVGLRIEIDHKDRLALLREASGEIYRGSGLADAPFLIGQCDDFHSSST